MSGSITRRNENTWKITIELPRVIPGKRNRAFYTVHGTKKDAEKVKNEKLKELSDGILLNNKQTFSSYLDLWLSTISYSKKESTIDEYSHYINRHIKPYFKNTLLQDLRTEQIQTFYNFELSHGRLDGKGGVSAKTLQNIHRIIHPVLEMAYNNDLIHRNVANGVILPTPEKYKAEYLTKEQLRQILIASENSDIYIPIAIGIFTGARNGEVLGLTWNNIDFENQTLTIEKQLRYSHEKFKFETPKTKSSIRTISIPTILVEILKKYQKEQLELQLKLGSAYGNSFNLICTTPLGEPIKTKNLSKKFNRFLKENQLPIIRFHDLRHSHASLLYSMKIQDKYISQRLGHSSCSTTKEIYTHLYKEDEMKIGNMIEDIFEKNKVI